MPLYEVLCITTPTATTAHLTTLLKKISVDCTKRGAVFRRIDNLGVRPLAYRMKAHNKFQSLGRYMRLWIQSAPRVIDDVEHRLRVDEEVVRFLTFKAPAIAPKRPPRHAVLESQKLASTKITEEAVLDYYAAQILLRTSLITGSELHACGTHYEGTNKPQDSAISVFTSPAALAAAQAQAQGQKVTPSLFATSHHLFDPRVFESTYQVSPQTEMLEDDIDLASTMELDPNADSWSTGNVQTEANEQVAKAMANMEAEKNKQQQHQKGGKKKGKK